MKKLLCALLVAICTVDFATAQTNSTLPDSLINQLKINVAGFKDRYHSPSVVVVIVHDQDIVFSEALGYSDVEHKTPATIDAKYPIMSLTKTFTATMMIQLQQRGVLRLDDDVAKYLPTFQQNVSGMDKAVTTLFQLATHTSGLPRNAAADLDFTKQIDKFVLTGRGEDFVSAATDAQVLNTIKYIHYEYPKFQFLSSGDRHYSNLGYSLLGMAVQKAAKTGYANYISQNILKPLKMDQSGFLTDDIYSSLASGYIYREDSKTFEKVPHFRPGAAMYAGGMYTTARDMAKFISFQFDNSISANKILSADNKAMMVALKIAWKPSYPFTFHEGAMLGYRSEMSFDPESKIGWVILTNTTNFEFNGINDVLAKLLLQAYVKKPVLNLNDYVGTYKPEGQADKISIVLKDSALQSDYFADVIPVVSFKQIGVDRFNANSKDNYAVNYEFVRDENGRVKGVNMGQLFWVRQ